MRPGEQHARLWGEDLCLACGETFPPESGEYPRVCPECEAVAAVSAELLDLFDAYPNPEEVE